MDFCKNKLKVFGDIEIRKKFAEFVKDNIKIFSLKGIELYAKNYSRLKDYDRISTGTIIANCEYKFYKNMSVYIFDTIWAPPEDIILKISKQFPELHFMLEFDVPWPFFKKIKGKRYFKDGRLIKKHASIKE